MSHKFQVGDFVEFIDIANDPFFTRWQKNQQKEVVGTLGIVLAVLSNWFSANWNPETQSVGLKILSLRDGTVADWYSRRFRKVESK